MEEILQKALARSASVSRRLAEEWIAAGRVSVGGKKAVLGQKIDGTENGVRVDGRLIRLLPVVSTEVWMLYKPCGVVCTHAHFPSEKNVWDLLPKSFRRSKWICMGRLDKDSEGLLLLSNNGDVAHRIAHPSFGVVKTYHVALDKELETRFFPLLREGIVDNGEHLSFVDICPLKTRMVEAKLSRGKKREIRRLFERFGFEVRRLKRVRIGRLMLPNDWMPGMMKRLSSKEINLIFQ
jgi:23S rRNA pseudouridine2605 synthase